MLTVILPAYNEEAMIEMAGNVISDILRKEEIPFEILFVDDGSKDGTWEAIEKIASEKQEIRGISFSRNFGKEAAVAAGLAEAGGECAVVLDCDLQHPPEKTVEMYRLWQQGASTEALRQAAALEPDETETVLTQGTLTLPLTLPAHGLCLLELTRQED